MILPKTRNFASLVCLWVLAACASADPLMIPRAEDVSSIEGQISHSSDAVTKTHASGLLITDAKRIAEVIHFLEGVNSRMSIPSDTFPTPTHTIILKDSTGKNLVVFVGENWIGGRNNVAGEASKNRLRKLSEEQHRQFLEMVGIRD